MNLTIFIKKLKEIALVHGGDAEIVMADHVPVTEPLFSHETGGKKIFITDQNVK